MKGRTLAPLVLLLCFLAGCDDPPPALTDAPSGPLEDAAAAFQPENAGSITGRVLWQGERPSIRPFRSIEVPLTDQPPPPARDWPNPHAPAIHPSTGGMGGAVVFLRGIDPRQGRKWDHPPVRVELNRFQMKVHQGPHRGRVGFVRRGDTVRLLSRQPIYHSVQGRGADFFARALAGPGATGTRQLDRAGAVELRSGSGYFWIRGHLFVDDHPYYARTDAEGRFRLDLVPAGDYEIVAWHPNWRVAAEERNQETYRVQQVHFAPPLQAARKVRVEPRGTAAVDLTLSLDP